MRILRLAPLLILTAFSGALACATIADDVPDGSASAEPDAQIGPNGPEVRLAVTDASGPVVGETVAFHNSSGALLAERLTDASGVAMYNGPDSSDVTHATVVILSADGTDIERLISLMDIAFEVDQSVYIPRYDHVSSFSVRFNGSVASATSYWAFNRCFVGVVTNPADSINWSVERRCLDRNGALNVMAFARQGANTILEGTHVAGHPANQSTVMMPSFSSSMAAFNSSVTGSVSGSLHMSPALIAAGATTGAYWTSAGTTSSSMNLPTNFGELANARFVHRISNSQTSVIEVIENSTVPVSIAVDAGDFLAPPGLIKDASRILWPAVAGVDGYAAKQTTTDDTEWTFILPASGTSVTRPVLPSELQDIMDAKQWATHEVVAIDHDGIANDTRAFMDYAANNHVAAELVIVLGASFYLTEKNPNQVVPATIRYARASVED